MDQIKIGKFIAELRRGRDMTQLQLADKLGVSDKTVSKWETGKGLPEISALMPLCETLGINVNELLSGEHLAQEDYSQKAEENMMNLMQHKEESDRRSRALALPAAVTAVAVILLIVFSLGHSGVGIMALLDTVSLLALCAPTALILRAAGLSRELWRGLKLAVGGAGEAGRAREALALAARALLCCGVLESLLQVYLVLVQRPADLEANLAVAGVTALYGLMAYLILLPLRSRLESVS